jgi:hypothetical protein
LVASLARAAVTLICSEPRLGRRSRQQQAIAGTVPGAWLSDRVAARVEAARLRAVVVVLLLGHGAGRVNGVVAALFDGELVTLIAVACELLGALVVSRAYIGADALRLRLWGS